MMPPPASSLFVPEAAPVRTDFETERFAEAGAGAATTGAATSAVAASAAIYFLITMILQLNVEYCMIFKISRYNFLSRGTTIVRKIRFSRLNVHVVPLRFPIRRCSQTQSGSVIAVDMDLSGGYHTIVPIRLVVHFPTRMPLYDSFLWLLEARVAANQILG